MNQYEKKFHIVGTRILGQHAGICKHCGKSKGLVILEYLDWGRTSTRVQCPACWFTTLSHLTICSNYAYKDWERGRIWNTDDEGFPIYQNGQRVHGGDF